MAIAALVPLSGGDDTVTVAGAADERSAPAGEQPDADDVEGASDDRFGEASFEPMSVSETALARIGGPEEASPATSAAPTAVDDAADASTTTQAPTTTEAPPSTTAPPITQAPPPEPEPQPEREYAYDDPRSTQVWYDLAQCEAGGNWAANTGNGYYGGLQFSLGSWQGVGGTGYPHEHSAEHQIEMGRRLHAQQGWGAWPHCSEKLGLR